MKKIAISIIAVCSLQAAEPMVPESMSTDRGGIKSAIDAYSDGGGAYLYDEKGRAIFNNDPMNKLVFKYGQSAKDSGINLKDQIKTVAPSTEDEKILADAIPASNSIINASNIIDGMSCDDKNIDTINDVYINGVCTGVLKKNFLNLTPGTTYLTSGGCGTCYIPMTLSQNTGKYYAEFEISAFSGTNHYFGVIFNNGTQNIVYRYTKPLLPIGSRVSILIDTDNLKVDVYANGSDRISYYSGNITNITSDLLTGMKIYLNNGTSKATTSYKVISEDGYKYKPF